MSCEFVRQQYGVPAEIGRRVIVDGKPGIIAADRGGRIGVNFDADKPNMIYDCHPTWKVEYLEMGEVRRQTRSQQRYNEFLASDGAYGSFGEFLKYRYGKKREGWL